MNKNVIWKAIPGYEGYYEVSTEGEIRSLDRYVNNRNSFVVGRIMHLSMGPSGYLQVGLCKNGKRKNFKVHKIVAKVFIPNPDNKPYVNHINGIKTDNRKENLEWVTAQENTDHAIRTGLYDPKAQPRFRCDECDFDLCDKCIVHYLP